MDQSSTRHSDRLRSAKRSRKGCPECRKRKIKCDETKPHCGQCQKGSRRCTLQDSVFKIHELSGSGGSARPSRRKARTTADGAAAGRPRSTGANDLTPARGCPGDESLHDGSGFDSSADGTSFDHISVDYWPSNSLSLLSTAIQIRGDGHQEHDYTLNHGDGPQRGAEASQLEHFDFAESPLAAPSIAAVSTIGSLKDTQEELFLLRHYSDSIAPWMDLLYQYEVFSREVLALAHDHPILRYAACAVAAKQLGQMKDPISTAVRGKNQTKIAQSIRRGKYGFVWYGIKYYEKAIQTLVKSISPAEPQTGLTPKDHASPAVSLSRGDLMVRADGEDPIVRLLGTCILIQYEALSANRDAWSGHLTGFSKLLDLIDGGKLLQPYHLFAEVYPWTKDIMEVKAGFWNFVVNDLEESFVSQRRTRIDTENLDLWRNMGLLVEPDGRTTLTGFPNSVSTTAEHVRNKVMSFALIRLMCKLVDYLAPLSHWELSLVHPESSPANHGVEAFLDIKSRFDDWQQMLSASLHRMAHFTTKGTEIAQLVPVFLVEKFGTATTAGPRP